MIRLLTVDAFTDRPFGGNPAAICVLETEASAAWMQLVAAEMNLSETAFVRPRPDGFSLRWFTPTVEVDLCGHATLATAHALWSERIAPDSEIRFHTKCGVLTCQRTGGLIEMNFPASATTRVDPPPRLFESLGITSAVEVRQTQFDHLVALESEQTVRSLTPDYALMKTIPTRGVIATAPSDDPRYDMASRFFAPAVGVNEDPVCGSAHCALAPYWGTRLGKTSLVALQASARVGVLHLRISGNRVILAGNAVTVWRGELLAKPE